MIKDAFLYTSNGVLNYEINMKPQILNIKLILKNVYINIFQLIKIYSMKYTDCPNNDKCGLKIGN